jgi:hypothetical protein
MTKEEHNKYVESVKRLCKRFNITLKEYDERNSAGLFVNSTYDYPNWVIFEGNYDHPEEYEPPEILYFDGDDGRAVIKIGCEIFDDEGVTIKLHECNYCDLKWDVVKEIIDDTIISDRLCTFVMDENNKEVA